MKNYELISDKVRSKIRTAGAQPARLHDLPKVHKNEIPLHPVLSIPGKIYRVLHKSLTPFLKKYLAQTSKNFR